MKKSFAIMLGVALLAAGFLAGLRQARAENNEAVALGAKVADFTLPDTAGKDHALSALKGKKGTLIFFTTARCPMVAAYHERLLKIAQDYPKQGVSVIAINSNADETVDQIKQHAADKKLPYIVLRDADNKIANQFDAQVTPETYLLDAAGKLVYHGGVDDNRAADLVKNSYLRNALDAMLAGKPIERAETRSFGCSVKRAS